MTALELDPVTLSVMASALSGVAEEMGQLLIRGAYSSNIKERRDCSAALFDAQGRMVAQAEHIPVHLGAMPEAVAAVLERSPQLGDIFMLNDPYSGGTHLPDITLVSPLGFGDQIIGYAVTRAHHSDVGGMSPGSMPAGSREIYQEGLVIPPVRLVHRNEQVEDVMALVLANVRTPEIRRGDLRAQISSHRLAQQRVEELIGRRGWDTLLASFNAVIDYSARRTRDAIRRLPDGEYAAESQLEGDGITEADIPIHVTVTIAGDRVRIDFAGTSPATAGNVNCPLAVTKSACCFALRVALPHDIPANSGAFSPLTVVAPRGSLVNAERPSAVVAGNVETSQRIADTVLSALSEVADLPAAGQGTMNNMVLGGAAWTYYETIGGGQGASRTADGQSGIHVGMSNTLNTPIESLELDYPMRVERYELRYGSGGEGAHCGGDGVTRSVRLLEPARLSLLTDRRRHAPAGKEGGASGSCGENLLNGAPLPAKCSAELAAGDVVTVHTPGGGGYGRTE